VSAQQKIKASNKKSLTAKALLIATVLLVLYVLVPQIKYFHNSFATIRHADYAFVGWGVLFVVGTYVAAAATYCFVSYYKLNYWRTVLIQVADGFTNRLLPAGAGGIATNVVYLSRLHKSRIKAGLVVGLNNLIGFVGHLFLLFILLSANSISGSRIITIKLPENLGLVVAIVALVVLIGILFRRRLARLAPNNANSIADAVKSVLQHPRRMLAAFVSSMVLTVCYALTLYMVMLALNVHISLPQVFIVLTVGVAALAVTPTPGGLGGVEAGIVAAQISVGVTADQALSVAFVYRVLTYWLPLLPGFVALRVALKRAYLVI